MARAGHVPPALPAPSLLPGPLFSAGSRDSPVSTVSWGSRVSTARRLGLAPAAAQSVARLTSRPRPALPRPVASAVGAVGAVALRQSGPSGSHRRRGDRREPG